MFKCVLCGKSFIDSNIHHCDKCGGEVMTTKKEGCPMSIELTEKYKLSDKQVKDFCSKGCSVDCQEFLQEYLKKRGVE